MCVHLGAKSRHQSVPCLAGYFDWRKKGYCLYCLPHFTWENNRNETIWSMWKYIKHTPRSSWLGYAANRSIHKAVPVDISFSDLQSSILCRKTRRQAQFYAVCWVHFSLLIAYDPTRNAVIFLRVCFKSFCISLGNLRYARGIFYPKDILTDHHQAVIFLLASVHDSLQVLVKKGWYLKQLKFLHPFCRHRVKARQNNEVHFNISILISRLALNHAKQNPVAPGKFQQTIAREKQNIAYDTEMH